MATVTIKCLCGPKARFGVLTGITDVNEMNDEVTEWPLLFSRLTRSKRPAPT